MNALLFLTHNWSMYLEAQTTLLSSIEGHETWILNDSINPLTPHLLATQSRTYCFSLESIVRLPYIALPTGGLKGNAHFPILEFFLANPGFSYYWVMENDVRYTGVWEEFFLSFEGCTDDLITAHVREFAEEPSWPWWTSFGRINAITSHATAIRSLNVIYRISQDALRFLHSELSKGWYGHHEVLIATLLHWNGFSIADLGGDGAFTPTTRVNKNYFSSSADGGLLMDGLGTIAYRPIRATVGELQDKLYHPVKGHCVI